MVLMNKTHQVTLIIKKINLELLVIKGSAVCAMEDREPEIGVKSIERLMKAVDEWIPTPVVTKLKKLFFKI